MGSTDSHWFLNYRGKDPRKPKRFSWSVQGSLRGNRNPLRLFFFCQRFLLEKQKKMLDRTCKFAAVHRPLCSFSETPEASPMRGSCRRRRLMRWTVLRRRKCPHLIRHGSTVTPSPRRGRLFYAHSRQLYHFSYTQLSQIKYHISNMANMTIMIWNFRAFFHVRSGLE